MLSVKQFLSKIFGLNKNKSKNQFSLEIDSNKGLKTDLELDIKNFKSSVDYWEFITNDDKWYLKYSPLMIKNIDRHISEFAPLIIEKTNELRREMEFTYDEYWKIVEWDNLLIREDRDKTNSFNLGTTLSFKQYCSNCKNETSFSQRYPKSICRSCYNKITDLQGRKVVFYNTEAMGHGCQGYYLDSEQKEKYDTNECYINGKTFFAAEARFGGIVIQLKE